MSRVIVALLGARRHYAVPRLFHEAGLLECFYTDAYLGNKLWLEKLLRAVPESLRPRGLSRWLGRLESSIPAEKVVSFDLLGIRYAWARMQARDSGAQAQVFEAYNREFNHKVLRTGLQSADVIWGFNGACLEIFRWAKANGKRCVVEQTIAPWRIQRQLLAEEIERWPGWQPALVLQPQQDKLSQREEAEWALADLIVVGSEFVAEGLRACDVPADRIQVVPYGVDACRYRPVDRSHRGRLRILFAGEIGLRKGVPYLLQALRSAGAGQVEVRMAGSLSLASHKIAPFRDMSEFLGPVPRPAMTELFGWADIFVLPSIVEGSATVTYEALASGLPIITTPNAGSVVRNGVEGFVLPIRDIDALKNRIEDFCADRALLSQMAEAARVRALDFTLERYRDRLREALESVL